jgi:hypothetical protein
MENMSEAWDLGSNFQKKGKVEAPNPFTVLAKF